MNITAVRHGHGHVAAGGHQNHAGKRSHAMERGAPARSASGPDAIETAAVVDKAAKTDKTQKTAAVIATDKAPKADGTNKSELAAEKSERPRGVIANLIAGHYKGVAAVRLSINFHAELVAHRQETAQGRVGENIAALEEGLSAVLDALPEDLGEEQTQAVVAAREQFSAALQALTRDPGEGGVATAAALSDIQSIYAELAQALRSALSENDPEAAATDVAIPVQSIDTAPTEQDSDIAGIEAYLANVQQVFDESMTSMQESVAAVAAMPEFTAPRGNGVAFEKFLGIYRDMLAAAHEVSGATGTEQADNVDLQA